jgi:hypothetical protein
MPILSKQYDYKSQNDKRHKQRMRDENEISQEQLHIRCIRHG